MARECQVGGVLLYLGNQGSLTDKVTFEQRPKESKWVSQENNKEKNVLSQGNSWCQGPEVEIYI